MNTDFTELPFGLEGRVFRSPMPLSGYDPMNEVWGTYQEQNIEVVVLLTEPQDYWVYAKRDLPAFYRSAGMKVIHLPIPDFQPPRDIQALDAALEEVENHSRAGHNVAVHCLAGLGRTGTFLACLAKRVLALDGTTAIEWVRQFVPGALENPEQERFVVGYDPSGNAFS